MPYTPIVPKGSPPPLAPYSPGAKAGNVVYVFGTLAIDKDGKTVGVGDARAQTSFILESIRGLLEPACGGVHFRRGQKLRRRAPSRWWHLCWERARRPQTASSTGTARSASAPTAC